MIALLCEDASLRKALAAILARSRLRVARGALWDELIQDDRMRSDACVYACVKVTAEDRRALERIRAIAPALPVILLTTGDLDNASRTAPVKVDHLVWLERVERDLVPVVLEFVARTSTLERFSRIIAGDARGINPRVHRVMLELCHSAPPVPRAQELGGRAFLSETKVREAFRTFCNGRPRATSRLLVWVRVLCAYDAAGRGVRPIHLPEFVQVDERTLVREVRELVGCGLSQLPLLASRRLLRIALEDLRLVIPDEGRESLLRAHVDGASDT